MYRPSVELAVRRTTGCGGQATPGPLVSTVSVIICAYTERRWTDLLAAVASVQSQHSQVHEIVVVIDHNDQLMAQAQVALPSVTVIANAEERGLSGARNTGIARATGAILAFLDDDAAARPDWLERLVAPFDDDNVLGVGGAAVPVWAGAPPAWFPAEFLWVVGCSYTGMPTQVAEIRNLMGCNMAFRSNVFAEVGGFRPGIGRVGRRPVGCEETELCIRARQHFRGGTFIFRPDAAVCHRVPEERSRPGYFRARCYAEGISKALVSRCVGTGDALSSERAYVLRTLPVGIVRRLRSRSGGPARFRQAFAIVAGVGVTAAGYFAGRISSRSDSFQPVQPVVRESL